MSDLFFIAIIPSEPVFSEIHALKVEVSEKFGSAHALKSPPHITLHMPFKWKDSRIGELNSVINELNSDWDSFDADLNGFDFFEPRVVFVNVMKNENLEILQKKVVAICRKQLKLANANYKDRAFHPHVTIGFRDLKKPDFYLARDYYSSRKYEATFQVSEVTLLRHTGKEWEVIEW